MSTKQRENISEVNFSDCNQTHTLLHKPMLISNTVLSRCEKFFKPVRIVSLMFSSKHAAARHRKPDL